MRTLIQNLRQQFDLIIIDTPPMMGINRCQNSFYPCRWPTFGNPNWGRTSRSDLKRVLSDLQNTVQAPLLGLVLNGVDLRNSGSYYNRYYRYYSPQPTGLSGCLWWHYPIVEPSGKASREGNLCARPIPQQFNWPLVH